MSIFLSTIHVKKFVSLLLCKIIAYHLQFKLGMFCLLFFVCFLTALCGIQDHSSLTRYQTHTPVLEAQSLNHGTTREVLFALFYLISISTD